MSSWKTGWTGMPVLALALVLAGCGSGGDGGGGVTAAPAGAAVLAGTVATGAALVGGTVTITDRTGAAVCTNAPLTTGTAGEYSCTVSATAQAPFVIAVVDPAGLVRPMVSLVTAPPAGGQTGTANVSPLTTAIVAQVAPNSDAFALAADPALVAALDLGNFDAVKRNVVAQLAAVLASVGVDAQSFDPVTTPFTGGSNRGVDAMLDQVRVTFENGRQVLTNVLNPDQSVPLADAGTAAPAAVPVSAAGSGFSPAELDFASTRFAACFAVPSATRDGSTACQDIVVDDAPPALTGGATYLHSGFGVDQAFGPLLANPAMDNAKFNRPEMLRYTKRSDGRDEAVVNVKFTRKDGVPDNRILVVKKFPGTAGARGTDWWVYGNQQNLNFRVRAALRQQEQTVAEGSQAPFWTPSRYQSGLEIFIARPCTNVQAACPNSAGIWYVRVKGPGLPTNGLVYSDTSLPPAAQAWMSMLNADGNIPAGAQVTTPGSNNIFYLQQSQGVSGTAAFAVRPNPGVAQSTPPDRAWAHPAMYGETPSAAWTFDLGRVPAWSQYTFEVFRNGQTTTTETYSTRILTPVVPAASGAIGQWHAIPSTVKGLASAGAPEANSLGLAWEINDFAQRIESMQVYTFTNGSRVNSASTTVPPGASSGTVTAVGGVFPALGAAQADRQRQLQWRYKMLDGSYKDQTVTYN